MKLKKKTSRKELLEVEIKVDGQIPVESILETYDRTFYFVLKESGYTCRPHDYSFDWKKRGKKIFLFIEDFDLHYFSEPDLDFRFLEDELVSAVRFVKDIGNVEYVKVRFK